jgi:hypothetical protein
MLYINSARDIIKDKNIYTTLTICILIFNNIPSTVYILHLQYVFLSLIISPALFIYYILKIRIHIVNVVYKQC